MYDICKEHNLDMLKFSADVFYDTKDMESYCDDKDYYVQKYALNQVKSGPEIFAENQLRYDARGGHTPLRCVRTEFIQSNNLYYVEGLRYADGHAFHLYMGAERVMIISDIFYSRRLSEVFDYYGIKYEYIVTDKHSNPKTLRNRVVNENFRGKFYFGGFCFHCGCSQVSKGYSC